MAQHLGDIFPVSYAKTLKNESCNFFFNFPANSLLFDFDCKSDYLFLYRIYFLIKPLREIFCLAM